MSKTDMKTKLVNLLKVIFQFEDQDLDFGIYRIMNQKREDIKKFIDQELIKKINEQLQLMGEEEKKKILEQLQKLKSRIKEAYGEDAFKDGELKDKFKEYPLGKKYTEKLQQLKTIEISEDLEREIYNHIYSFFSRYYDKGDFVSKRRVGRQEKYAIPYSGQETLLHWTNKDQYYVKTTLQFKKYTFKINGLTVNFRVVQAEEEKGNLKADEDRYFVIHEEKPFELDGEVLNIYFEYRPLEDKELEERKFGKKPQISQQDVNQFNFNVLKRELGEKKKTKALFKKENDRTVLDKNLYKFTTSNKSDYFIHKNLKQFLTRELDFYIKNEVLGLEDIKRLGKEDLDRYLLKAKVIYNISLVIIEFLSQIEKLQRKLWEKKKFVVRTDYVITLGKIKKYAGEEFLKSILDEIVKNEGQIKEWKELLGVEVESSDLSEDLSRTDRSKYDTLPIDTKYFDEKFKLKLLETITKENNFERILDGLLVKGENFQALNLLSQKYNERVKCFYIDPPYNTGSDEFIYKDRYQHSSWLSMMYDRLAASQKLSTPDGVIFISIDDHELFELSLIVESVFGVKAPLLGPVIVQVNKGGRSYLPIAKMHEYIVCSSTGKGEAEIYEIPQDVKFKYSDSRGNWMPRELRNRNPKFTRENRPNLFYPFFIDPKNRDKDEFCVVSLKRTKKHKIKVVPKNREWKDDCWRWNEERAGENIDPNDPEESDIVARQRADGGWNIYEKYRKTTTKAKSIWLESSVRTENGTIQLRNLFGSLVYDYPKPVELVEKCIKIGAGDKDLIMDFFAGSGTTAHAVMKLNKQDGGNRKFILVDIADFFDTIMLARIKKIAYSLDWKKGKVQSVNGPGGFFKCHYLEQYEDALENIQFEQRTIEEFGDYFVQYMLDFETRNSATRLNIDDMQDPFNYKIKVLETLGRPPKRVNVDLVETFNYLIGLNVNKIKVIEENERKYLFVLGEVDDVKTLVVWRSLKDIDFKEDKKVIERIRKELGPDEVYVNGDAGIRDFKQIENEFKSLLWG